MEFLLASHGFEVVEKTRFGDGHSIFYVSRLVSKADGDRGSQLQLPSLLALADGARVAQSWYDHMLADAQAATAQLTTNRSLNFLYAAHAGSQYLLALGMPEEVRHTPSPSSPLSHPHIATRPHPPTHRASVASWTTTATRSAGGCTGATFG